MTRTVNNNMKKEIRTRSKNDREWNRVAKTQPKQMRSPTKKSFRPKQIKKLLKQQLN
jgi:hypothetical protein